MTKYILFTSIIFVDYATICNKSNILFLFNTIFKLLNEVMYLSGRHCRFWQNRSLIIFLYHWFCQTGKIIVICIRSFTYSTSYWFTLRWKNAQFCTRSDKEGGSILRSWWFRHQVPYTAINVNNDILLQLPEIPLIRSRSQLIIER